MKPLTDTPIVRDGTALVLAYDHGLEHGPSDFEERPATMDPETIFDLATHDAVTGLAVQKGIAETYYPSYEDDVALLAKVNGTSDLWMGEPDSAVNWSVEYAAELGADAVGFTLYGGSNNEVEMAEEFRVVQEAARDYDLPVVMWAYPRGQGVRNNADPEVVSYAARQAFELGADVAKVGSPGDREAMERVDDVSGPVEVVLSGGAKGDPTDFLSTVEDVMAAGWAGVTVGRNVWQREDAAQMIEALAEVIHEGADAESAGF